MAVETVKVAIDGSDKVPAEDANKKPAEGESQVQAKEGDGESQVEGAKGEGAEVEHPADALTDKPQAEVKDPEQAALEKATGLDLSKYADEFVKTGKLSEGSFKELAEKGITEETASIYIAGLQAKSQQRLTDLASAVGGVDGYNAILGWAKDKLTDEEKIEAVQVLSAASPTVAKAFLKDLQSRYVAEHGKAPKKSSGSGSGAVEDVYADRQEQRKAMADSRYRTDPRYRREVEAKSIRSFGNPTRKRTKAAPKNSRRARSKGSR